MQLKSEFASVEVAVDHQANGLRLKITDQVRGRTCYLDPLQVECLTRMAPEILDRYLPFETDKPKPIGEDRH